jgi:hypothetical protein
MQNIYLICTVFLIAFVLVGCSEEGPVSSDLVGDESASLAKGVTVSRVPVTAFQPAGNFGGGVLVPETMFPPTKGGTSTLRRGDDWLSYNIHTTGLPPGAYTNWWIIWNYPENCSDGACDDDDFVNPDNPAGVSVFWATGGIVQENGVGNFHGRAKVGELPGGEDQVPIPGPGLVNPKTALVLNIIKYHGPASDDPDDLFLQTYTLTGLCGQDANGYDLGPPFGIQCFDPQVAVHIP